MNGPASGKAVRRLRELLSLDFGFVLWDGSAVPADLPSNALAIVFADEGVVAAMLRRPNADTFLNLWVTARIDIRNGVIFSISSRTSPSCEPKRSADVSTSVWQLPLSHHSVDLLQHPAVDPLLPLTRR